MLSYIKGARDLRSLYLTSRTLSPYALPPLYKVVSLPISKINKQLAESFHERNPGLVYIQYLQIRELRQSFRSTTHETHLLNLLNVLPWDKLKLVYIDTASEMSSAVDTRILRKQRKLKMLTLHTNLRIGLHFALPANRFQTLVSLSLFVMTKKDLTRYEGIIQQLVNLTDLSIIRMSYFLEEDRQRRPAPSMSILQTLFNPNREPAGVQSKLKLTRLYLDGFDFFDCGKELVDFLDVHYLKELALIVSAGTSTVVEKLSQYNFNLETFIDDRFEDWQPAQAVIDHLLQQSEGLKVFKRR